MITAYGRWIGDLMSSPTWRRRTMDHMVTVRYWAAARSAAGCVEETFPATTVTGLVEAISARHDMARLMKACSLLIDGVAAPTKQADQVIADGSGVDVLPPFAGG